MTEFVCDCRVCITAREYERIISQLPTADRMFMDKFYEDHCCEMLDANVNQAIIDGTWPNADEIIQHMRDKNKKE